IYSLAMAGVLSISAASDGTLILGIALSLVIFVAAVLLNHFDRDWIARLIQLITAFGLLYFLTPGMSHHLPLNLRVAHAACALIAMSIPALTWPPRSSGAADTR
ncbi:MAG TPA: hypothetical protein VGQ35_05995, partial [Dongiaceae bacterium]|nr:hypothetical protein [Dongiaceae bacterium]